MSRSLLLLTLLAAAAGCDEREPRMTPAPRGRVTADAALDVAGADAALLEAVRQAYRLEASPRSIGRVVGARPAVDTSRASDRQVLASTEFAADPNAPEQGPTPAQWMRAMDVAYWVRPLRAAGGEAKIVGVAWYPDGRREVFYAVVVAPPVRSTR